MSNFITAFLSGKEEESSLENCKDWRWVFRIPRESSCCNTFSQFSGIYQLTQVLASWTIFWLCPRKCKELILLKSPQKWCTTASVNYLIKRQNLQQLYRWSCLPWFIANLRYMQLKLHHTLTFYCFHLHCILWVSSYKDLSFFYFSRSPIPQVIKVKFQARTSSTMDDEYSYYGKDHSLQFAMNVNWNQSDNILVFLFERLLSWLFDSRFCSSSFRYRITDKWT